MGSTLGSYEIAKSGMQVSERSLFVTGHNISNATTPGYVRQQAIIATSRYSLENNRLQTGQGAFIEQTRQIRHVFLDKIFRNENTSLGYWETRTQALNDMETVLGDPQLSGVEDESNVSGLQNVMNQFWDSWQELSKDPSSLTIRAVVRQRAITLAAQFNQVGNKLDEMQLNLNDEIKVRADEVNEITAKIANLNKGIIYNEAANESANDFRDQRNLLIDKLTKLADVNIQEMSGGWVNVSLGGEVLVNRSESNRIYTDKSEIYSPFHVLKLEGTEKEISIKSGVLKGLLDSRGDEFYCAGLDAVDAENPIDVKGMSVSDLKRMLNTMLKSVADELNNLHESGIDLRGDAGLEFFKPIDSSLPIGIGNIRINVEIERDLNFIAASASGVNAAYGNNENALLAANLRNKEFLGNIGQLVSPNGYYNNLILSLGSSGQEATGNANNQNILVLSADNARKAITDVSIDEEMSNMMKFQFAYGASSRVMNAIDEMVETVVSKMGLVGR